MPFGQPAPGDGYRGVVNYFGGMIRGTMADMRQYLDLMTHVLNHGTQKGDRTGTGTLSVFGYQMRFDLGVAAILPLVAVRDLERRVVLETIEPVWEGNQVWLILGAGAAFAAWPTPTGGPVISSPRRMFCGHAFERPRTLFYILIWLIF